MSPAQPSRYRAHVMWDATFDALAIVDDQRCYRRVNPATEALFGASADEIIEQRIDDFTPPELRSVLYRLWSELLRCGELHGPYEMVGADGRRRMISFRALRDFGDGEHLIIARPVGSDDGSVPVSARSAANAARLTVREREILQLAADGHTTAEIARGLVLSTGTVKTHFDHIRAKLGVRDRAAAVAEGIRAGAIS